MKQKLNIERGRDTVNILYYIISCEYHTICCKGDRASPVSLFHKKPTYFLDCTTSVFFRLYYLLIYSVLEIFTLQQLLGLPDGWICSTQASWICYLTSEFIEFLPRLSAIPQAIHFFMDLFTFQWGTFSCRQKNDLNPISVTWSIPNVSTRLSKIYIHQFSCCQWHF